MVPYKYLNGASPLIRKCHTFLNCLMPGDEAALQGATVREVPGIVKWNDVVPMLTAKDFDVTRSTPAVVTGKQSPTTYSASVRMPKEVSVEVVDGRTGRATMVIMDAANVRSGPSKSTAKVFVIRSGEAVEVMSQQGSWSQIRDPDGRTGWIWTEFLGG